MTEGVAMQDVRNLGSVRSSQWPRRQQPWQPNCSTPLLTHPPTSTGPNLPLLQRGLLVNDTIIIRYQIELVVSSGGALSRSTSKPPVPQVGGVATLGCCLLLQGWLAVCCPGSRWGRSPRNQPSSPWPRTSG